MRLRLRDTSPIKVPALFGLASLTGLATAIIASVAVLFVDAYNPVLALAYLPYVLLIASLICLIAANLALSVGLGSRALTTRIARSSRAGAITGGLAASATGVAIALIMFGPLSAFGPAFWMAIAASTVGGVALVAWALRCSPVK